MHGKNLSGRGSPFGISRFSLTLSAAVRNSCSIVSGDISNCSNQLPALPLTSSHLSRGDWG